METSADELGKIVDREKIRDCLARLCRGEDRRDAELIKGCYWPDATDDHGVFVGSFEEYLAWVVPGEPSIRLTLHTLGQSLIDLKGASAVVESHATSYHRVDMGEAEHDVVIGGRYLDRMEKRDGEWRIAHRTMVYDWLRDFGQSVDWSQGLMGMPFLTRHCVGSTLGDPSEALFE